MLNKEQKDQLLNIVRDINDYTDDPIYDINNILTPMADTKWMLRDIKNLSVDNKIYLYDIKLLLETEINYIKDIVKSNMIEYAMQYSLEKNNKEIDDLEKALIDEMNIFCKKTGYYIKIKDFYKKRENAKTLLFQEKHIHHYLSFIEKTELLINKFLNEKIYQPLKNNTQYNQQKEDYIHNKKSNGYIKDFTLDIGNELDTSGIKGYKINLGNIIKVIISHKKYKGQWIPLEPGYYNAGKAIKELLKNIITTNFKKHPTIAKNIYELSIYQIKAYSYLSCVEQTFEIMNNVNESINSLKAEKINIPELLTPLNSFEKIGDIIKEVEINHQIKKLINGLLSNKNKHLMGFSDSTENNYKDSDNYKYFKELVGLKVDSSELQNSIGSKLSRYKTSDELGEVLKSYISTLNGFTMDALIKKSANFNTEIIEKNSDKNYLIIKIKDYTASEALGSQSWCISYDEYHFENYTNNNFQYFVYDFNLEFEDNLAMIGITLNQKWELYDSYDKHDDPTDREEIDEFVNIIAKKERKKDKKAQYCAKAR